MQRAELMTAVAVATTDAIRRELMISPCETLPPPNSTRTERRILGALLRGHVAHGDECLGTLAGEHFYSDVNARLFNVTKHTIDLQAIAKTAKNKGFRGDLAMYLESLADDCFDAHPLSDVKHIADAAWYVIELANQREILRAMTEIGARMRRKELVSAEACNELRAIVAKWGMV